MVWTATGQTGSRSHTSNIVPVGLAERIWWTKPQSSLLNIYFRLSGFQSSFLLIHLYGTLYGTNTSSNCTKAWHRTSPICDSSLKRSARRSIVPLQKSRRNHHSYVGTEALSGKVFVLAQTLFWIVWTGELEGHKKKKKSHWASGINNLFLLLYCTQPNSSSNCTKAWHRTSPICDSSLNTSSRLFYSIRLVIFYTPLDPCLWHY